MPNCPAVVRQDEEDEADHAFSPASSSSNNRRGGCSSVSSMSVSSSPVPSPAESTASSSSSYSSFSSTTNGNGLRRSRKDVDDEEEDEEEERQRRPKRTYRDSYEARLQRPLTPVRSLGVNSGNSNGSSSLPKATHRSDFDERLQDLFQLAVSRASHDELDLLLRTHSESIDLNRYDEEGQTPLQRFCQAGNVDLVRLMVQYGADARMRTREGWSVMHIASFAETGSSEMVAFLVKCCFKR